MEYQIPKTNYYIAPDINGWLLLYGKKRKFVFYFRDLEGLLIELQRVRPEDGSALNHFGEEDPLEFWAEDAMYAHIDQLFTIRKEFKHFLSKYDSYLYHDNSLSIRIYNSRYIIKPMGKQGWEIFKEFPKLKLLKPLKHCKSLANLLYGLPDLLIQLKPPSLMTAANPFDLHERSVVLAVKLIREMKSELEAEYSSKIVAPHMRYEILNAELPETGNASA